jgi:hypothetical protein
VDICRATVMGEVVLSELVWQSRDFCVGTVRLASQLLPSQARRWRPGARSSHIRCLADRVRKRNSARTIGAASDSPLSREGSDCREDHRSSEMGGDPPIR